MPGFRRRLLESAFVWAVVFLYISTSREMSFCSRLDSLRSEFRRVWCAPHGHIRHLLADLSPTPSDVHQTDLTPQMPLEVWPKSLHELVA
jgi:hypothetical protein